MFCSKCGTSIDEKAEFCSHCGNKLHCSTAPVVPPITSPAENSDESTVVIPTDEALPSASSTLKFHSKRPVFILCVIIISLLVILLGISLGSTASGKSDQPSSATTSSNQSSKSRTALSYITGDWEISVFYTDDELYFPQTLNVECTLTVYDDFTGYLRFNDDTLNFSIKYQKTEDGLILFSTLDDDGGKAPLAYINDPTSDSYGELFLVLDDDTTIIFER